MAGGAAAKVEWALFSPIWFPLFIYLDYKEGAGLEGVRPEIRVRIDQCRERKKKLHKYILCG